MLECFITSIYSKPGSITNMITGLLSNNLRNKAVRRKNEELPDDMVVLKCEFLALMCSVTQKLLQRFPFMNTVYSRMNNMLNDHFGKAVAKYAISHNVDAVISFDNNSAILFEYLRKNAPNIKRILDVSIASRIYLKKIYEKDYDQFGDHGLIDEQAMLWNDKYMMRIQKELAVSEYFLAGSQFVKKSLINSGVDNSQVYVVNYGVSLSDFGPHNNQEKHESLRLIFVGSVRFRKGIHHLLKVVSELENTGVCLSVVGDYSPNSDLYNRYKSFNNIRFLGFLTHDKLAVEYKKADVFVLPSLGEGMAMVGLEAMSCGLPIICSSNTGLDEVVSDGVTGFIFNAGDDDSLRRIIIHCANNKDELTEMGRKASNIAKCYSWDNYGRNIAEVVKTIINK